MNCERIEAPINNVFLLFCVLHIATQGVSGAVAAHFATASDLGLPPDMSDACCGVSGPYGSV